MKQLNDINSNMKCGKNERSKSTNHKIREGKRKTHNKQKEADEERRKERKGH